MMAMSHYTGNILHRLISRSSTSQRGLSRVTPRVVASSSSRRRLFHASPVSLGLRSQMLKDVGEGITEVQIIQWYVEEGARIEEWKPLCQYQSDKAVDDITSRYEGVIKKLHFQADDTVPTGKALCDIEVDDGKYPEDNATAALTASAMESQEAPVGEITSPAQHVATQSTHSLTTTIDESTTGAVESTSSPAESSKYSSLATPAVRGLLKELSINILDVKGTGKDGRVLKEDVRRVAAQRGQEKEEAEMAARKPMRVSLSTMGTKTISGSTPAEGKERRPILAEGIQQEEAIPLTPIQAQMFKTMTRSLNIPQFGFADEVNVTELSNLRRKLQNGTAQKKLTYLPFIIKAVSLALEGYPLLNARLDTIFTNNNVINNNNQDNKPKLITRTNHNIGIATDTPQGLIVPNIKNVQTLSITDIAAEVSRLSALGKSGKLTPADLAGGTFTISNIGSIGGTYVVPIIIPTELAILGIGRSRTVPVFGSPENEPAQAQGQWSQGKVAVVPAEMVHFSWSADHRVVDGATMARMANMVKEYLESPEKMLVYLR